MDLQVHFERWGATSPSTVDHLTSMRGGSYPWSDGVDMGRVHREAYTAAHRCIDYRMNVFLGCSQPGTLRQGRYGFWCGDGLSRLLRPSPWPTQSDRTKKMSRTCGRDDGESEKLQCQPRCNWGLDPFGKQKLAYRLLKTFPRGGPLTASIWAIVTWMTGDRCLNELDCT